MGAVLNEEVCISFTISAKSELINKTPKGIEEYFNVKVRSIAEPLDGGTINFSNPCSDDKIFEGTIITVIGERQKVFELLKKGIVD